MTYINNSNIDCNYEEDAKSTHNTMSISLQKYFVNVQRKHLCKRPLGKLNFSSNSCFENNGKLVLKCQFLQKITPMPEITQCQIYNFLYV